MKIKYNVVEGKAHLVIHDVDWSGFNQETKTIWIFIHGHQRFVLRQYYRECKLANVSPYYIEETDHIQKGLPVLVFNSKWEEHKSYIEILQRELKIIIEDLPR